MDFDKKIILPVVIIILILIVGFCLAGGFFNSSDDTSDSQQDSLDNSTDSNDSSDFQDSNSLKEYGPGTYTVGGDFKSGVYESSTADALFSNTGHDVKIGQDDDDKLIYYYYLNDGDSITVPDGESIKYDRAEW